MLHAAGLVADHRIQTDGVNAVKNTLFNVGILAPQLAQQQLDLLPLGAAAVAAVRSWSLSTCV